MENTEEIKELFGVVVLFEPNYKNKTVKEIRRSNKLPFMTALDVYANAPNPASQLLRFYNQEEYEKVDQELKSNTNNPEWLNDLFDQI